MRFPRPDARTKAVVAALLAVSLLVTLVVRGRQDFLGVVLALLCVPMVMIAAVSVAAARQEDGRRPAATPAAPGQPTDGLYGIDADTLETLDPRDAVRVMRERHRGRGSATGEGG
ncbi:hypothetical protein ACGF7U_27485 [Micromonospora sp. NPDC047670]|uniref:hypothetical protein n=1 Tax=Micromonospora sp. NPDC047670 TaxID=3364252 RepID=UPI00371F4E9B